MPRIRFKVIDADKKVGKDAPNTVYLVEDRWDDWGEYRTQFSLYVFTDDGQRVEAGSIKIGQIGLLPGRSVAEMTRYPNIPREFAKLSSEFFSLGQSENYYESLNDIDEDIRDAIHLALRDCAYDLSILDSHAEERVMRKSLLRDMNVKKVRSRFARLAHGNAALTEYQFEFTLYGESESNDSPPTISFDVDPHSNPPSNLHAIIGRNGVGKTRFMQLLINDITERDQPPSAHAFQRIGDNENQWSFSGVVVVSFSAFDSLNTGSAENNAIKVRRIGLHSDESTSGNRSIREILGKQFINGFGECRKGARRKRLVLALETLENDPLFKEAEIGSLLDLTDDEWSEKATSVFGKLSSGHAIVLLTITRLTELVEENTLVLLDEPECHLHPPMFSAFLRALSDLLMSRNGVGIIATHSPVVLQEVPKSCVWIMRRAGWNTRIERPENETFGENVGSLTKDVFGLEVTGTGFHALLDEAVQNHSSYEEVVAAFEGQIGIEGRAIIRSLIAEKAKSNGTADYEPDE